MHTQALLKVRSTPVSIHLHPLTFTYVRLHPFTSTQTPQIMHLRKYIAKQLDGVRPEEVEVLCKGAPVGPEYSLEFIRRTIWMDDHAKLVLEYRRQLT